MQLAFDLWLGGIPEKNRPSLECKSVAITISDKPFITFPISKTSSSVSANSFITPLYSQIITFAEMGVVANVKKPKGCWKVIPKGRC